NADWYRIGGGDGFYAQVDPTDYPTVYAESQNGNIQRLDLKTGRSVSIRPRAAQRPRGPGAARGGGQGVGQQPQTGAPAGAGGESGEGETTPPQQKKNKNHAPGGGSLFGGETPTHKTH